VNLKVKLDEKTFKIDRHNAKAMIAGFKKEKEEKPIHQCIYCLSVKKSSLG
jgi:hypothetical protein